MCGELFFDGIDVMTKFMGSARCLFFFFNLTVFIECAIMTVSMANISFFFKKKNLGIVRVQLELPANVDMHYMAVLCHLHDRIHDCTLTFHWISIKTFHHVNKANRNSTYHVHSVFHLYYVKSK
jgi:hypothetical protein